MKNLSLFKVLFLALAVFAISSCGEDDPDDPTTALGPNIEFFDGIDVISTNADLAPGEAFTVNIIAGIGDAELSNLAIYQDNALVDFSRITFAHTATANNPQTAVDSDVNGLDWTITILAQDVEDVSVYDFEITDKNQNKSNVSLDINTVPVINTVFETTLVTGTNCLSSSITADAQTGFCLSINATRDTDNALSTVTVYENNDVIDVSRLDWLENPLTLVDDEVNGVTGLSVNIQSHTVGTSEYRMVVTDASGATTEAGVFVTIGAPATQIDGILLNAAGPADTGGCDLNTGNGNVGSNAAEADIKDEGIDTSLPVDANWIQRISGTNGSEIRAANGLPEGFKFDNIAIKEEIIGAFDQSDVLGGNITPVVQIDDQFVVRNSAGDYFFIKITNVSETDTNNDDFYEFSIKQ